MGVFNMPKQYFKATIVARIIAVDEECMGKLQHAVESRTVKDARPISNLLQENELGRSPFKVIGIRPWPPVQNIVSLKLMQRKTLNLVINLPDVENIT